MAIDDPDSQIQRLSPSLARLLNRLFPETETRPTKSGRTSFRPGPLGPRALLLSEPPFQFYHLMSRSSFFFCFELRNF